MALDVDILLHNDLRTPEFVKSVVVTGPSCSGKTTLVRELRKSELVKEGIVDIPKRFVTRHPRLNDDYEENVHVNDRRFDEMLRNGEIDLNWERDLGSETGAASIARYGFAPPKANVYLTIYSANNALYHQRGKIPAEKFDTMLFVVVYCPQNVRRARFEQRSPDLLKEKPWEATLRLADERFVTIDEQPNRVFVEEPLVIIPPYGFKTLKALLADYDEVTGQYTLTDSKAHQPRPLRVDEKVPRGRLIDLLGDAHFTILTHGLHEATAPKSFVDFIGGLFAIGDPVLAQKYTNDRRRYSNV